MNIDIKLFFAVIAVIIGLIAFTPYVRDIFLKKTKPHVYTWLIWLITQGTATAGLWYGHGGWATWALLFGTVVCFIVFILSFKFGTKNITQYDTIILVAAILAIIVWWQLNNPLLAIFMVSFIDVLGYLPSFRKTFVESWTETLSSWQMAVVANIFSILALSQYNFLTLTYLIAIAIANLTMAIICIVRRRVIPKAYSN